jgi:hypothetical protein
MTSSELPKRSHTELAAALREHAGCLSGAAWEVPATQAMMREAADALESAGEALPEWWADAANDASGLCQSEARRMERVSPSTAAHWESVATRLSALYLAADLVHVANPSREELVTALKELRERWENTQTGDKTLRLLKDDTLAVLRSVLATYDPPSESAASAQNEK